MSWPTNEPSVLSATKFLPNFQIISLVLSSYHLDSYTRSTFESITSRIVIYCKSAVPYWALILAKTDKAMKEHRFKRPDSTCSFNLFLSLTRYQVDSISFRLFLGWNARFCGSTDVCHSKQNNAMQQNKIEYNNNTMEEFTFGTFASRTNVSQVNGSSAWLLQI